MTSFESKEFVADSEKVCSKCKFEFYILLISVLIISIAFVSLGDNCETDQG